MEIHELAQRAFARDLKDPGALEDAFSVVRLLAEQGLLDDARQYNKIVRAVSGREAVAQKSARFLEANRKALLFDAPYDFDCFIRYIEWNREPSKKFYMPRRKQLKPLVDAMQDLADDNLDLLAISMPPGTGKTTLAIFYLTWMGGRAPDLTCLGMSHNASFLNGVYNECLRIIKSDGEYPWSDVFPTVKITGTNAKDMRIDLGSKKRFETLEFSSIGSGNAGKVRATNLLYCDDLCSGIEEALSKDRLDKLWQLYTDDARQRKQGNPKELHIATRWSVHDVIGRLEGKYGESDRARFIVEAAMDENDESRFDYAYGVGFSTQSYREQREMMDDASWRALFMSEPIEREGQLYNADELRRYFELPDRSPDAILSVCDTKDRGTDYCFMPVVYQYGQDFYLDDCVLDNGAPELVEAQLVSCLLRNKVQMSRFESNSAGGKIAEKVQKEVKEKGGITKITTKYTTANKETKIIVNSPWVKEHVLFKDDSVIKKDKVYRKMLGFLCGYTMAGRNKNDDVPDGMAQLAEFIQSFEMAKVEVFRRPF